MDIIKPCLQTAGGVQREGELLLAADRVHLGAPQQEPAVLHRPRPGELSLVDTRSRDHCAHLWLVLVQGEDVRIIAKTQVPEEQRFPKVRSLHVIFLLVQRNIFSWITKYFYLANFSLRRVCGTAIPRPQPPRDWTCTAATWCTTRTATTQRPSLTDPGTDGDCRYIDSNVNIECLMLWSYLAHFVLSVFYW